MNRLHLPGIMTAAQARQTADYIASQQLASGLIPWFAGHHADPWDHVEAAMALDVAGRSDAARRAYQWSIAHQAPDGTWPMEQTADGSGLTVTNASVDTNQVAYFAVGVWHHWLVTRDAALVDEAWPAVRRAVDYVCEQQQPGGAVTWSRGPDGVQSPDALLTGSACLVLALRCALALAERAGEPQPDWELAAARLAHAVHRHPEAFADKGRFSMDWYYPVLGGAVRGPEAGQRLAARWGEFVVPGRGVRCVADRPWVTAAETCELVLALDAVGDRDRALALLRDIQFCRAEDGGYWTGWVFPERVFWPAERSTWTAAAVLLAVDALTGTTEGAGLFRGEGLPFAWQLLDCDENCGAGVRE